MIFASPNEILIEKSTIFSSFWNFNCDKLSLTNAFSPHSCCRNHALIIERIQSQEALIGSMSSLRNSEVSAVPLATCGSHQGQNAPSGVHYLIRHFSKPSPLLVGHSLWPNLYLLRLFDLKEPSWPLEDQARAERRQRHLKQRLTLCWTNVLRVAVASQNVPSGAFKGQWSPEAPISGGPLFICRPGRWPSG